MASKSDYYKHLERRRKANAAAFKGLGVQSAGITKPIFSTSKSNRKNKRGV